MFALWAVAGLVSAAAAGLILLRAARAAQAGLVDATPSVYRRQLSEIDDLVARGLMDEAERRSAKAEAGRRLLAASEQPAQAWNTHGGRHGVLAAAIVIPLAALGLYLAVGKPAALDQPYAGRLAVWRATDPAGLSPAELAAVLRQVVSEHPGDAEGWRYLALTEGSAGNGPAAVRALRHAVKLAPARADLWTLLGLALTYEARGQTTQDAIDAFQQALRRDPHEGEARFRLGQAQVDAGDLAGGLASWRLVLADLPPGDQRRGFVEQAMARAQAGARAVEQRPDDGDPRMVAGLAERLRARPDDPQGWVRLVRAYAVLGDAAARDAALAQAKTRYAGQPDIVQQLDAAAQAAPMASTGPAR